MYTETDRLMLPFPMSWLMFTTILASSVDGISKCPVTVPQDKWTQIRGDTCYRFEMDIQKEYDDAQEYCRGRGGDLVMIKSQEINKYIIDELSNKYDFHGAAWIGLNDRENEGEFVWVDGAPMQYSNLESQSALTLFFRHNMEDCVAIDVGRGGKWYAYRCSDYFLHIINQHKPFICEFRVEIPTTTLPPITTIMFTTATAMTTKSSTLSATTTTTTQTRRVNSPTTTTMITMKSTTTTPQPSKTTTTTIMTTKPPTTPSRKPPPPITTTMTTKPPTTPSPQPPPTTTTTMTTKPPTTPSPPPPSSTTTTTTMTTKPPSSSPRITTTPIKTTPQPMSSKCFQIFCNLDCLINGFKTDQNGCMICQCDN